MEMTWLCRLKSYNVVEMWDENHYFSEARARRIVLI